MTPHISDFIGTLSIGCNEFLENEWNAPIKWWERRLLKWLLNKRSLCAPLGYAQKRAWEKYKK